MASRFETHGVAALLTVRIWITSSPVEDLDDPQFTLRIWRTSVRIWTILILRSRAQRGVSKDDAAN
jgi:hypothetical protein